MRYISHEIRTPLNTVYMGIQLLTSNMRDLKQKSNVDTAPIEGMLSDIRMSCSAAIDILNDLLLYDKLEEGNMVLSRQPILVTSFIEECMHPFEIQV